MATVTGPRNAILVWVAMIAAMPAGAQPSPRIQPQELGLIYAERRFRAEFIAALGGYERIVAPRPGQRIPVDADTLGPWIMQQAYNYIPEAEEPWDGQVDGWEVIAPDQAVRHRRWFTSAGWSYLGANYFTALDTTQTSEIRAHLQSQFGSPSLTVIELGARSLGQAMQFEYWIVANDSIRVKVMDPTGPLDRGIILAANSRYRDLLFNLRQSLLGDVIHRTEPAPYTDYYYSPDSERWYQTGFDGRSYFTKRIRAPRLSEGRPEIPSN